MSKWEFFELDQDKSVVPLSIQNLKVVSWLENTLGVAAESKVPNPKFSKYYVNCACLVVDMIRNEPIHLLIRVSGGNIEYGLCQALHGEESLVAAVSSRLSELGGTGDKNRYAVFIAFSSRFETGRVPTCCGNCRDIMRDNFPINTMIFSGHSNGGKVIVSRLSDLLVDDFGLLNLNSPNIIIRYAARDTIIRGQYLENDIYFPGQPICDANIILQISAPILFFFDPLVHLVTYELALADKHPIINGYWETSVKKWLPYPFSPAAFGDEFVKYATDKFKSK